MDLGTFCSAIGITEEVLLGEKPADIDLKSLTNGVVWELQRYRATKKSTKKDFVDWIIKIFGLKCENTDALQEEFESNFTSMKNLRNAMVKTPRQYKNELDRFMNWQFDLPSSLGLEPVAKFEPTACVNLGPKLLKILKEKGNDDDVSIEMSGHSEDDGDDEEVKRRKAREELVQLKKDLGSARKIITSLNDKLNDLSSDCKLLDDHSKTSVSQSRRIESDTAKLTTEWKSIIENWHGCIERLNHVNNNKGNYLDVRYMVRRNKTKQGIFDELNFEFEKTVEEFKNVLTSTLDQEKKKKKRDARQKGKNGQKRTREESNDRDDSKVICLADSSDKPVVLKLGVDDFLKSDKVEEFKGGKFTNLLKGVFLHLSSLPVSCLDPSEYIFTVLAELEELNTDKIPLQPFAGNILMEARMLATLQACSTLIEKSKINIRKDSITEISFLNNAYNVTLEDKTVFVLGVRDITEGSPDTSLSFLADIYGEFTNLRDNTEDVQALTNTVHLYVFDRQLLSKKLLEVLFLYKQQLLPKFKKCVDVFPESLKTKFYTLNDFHTGLYFLQGLATLSDVTVLAWESMALDGNALESSSVSSVGGIHSSTLKKIHSFCEFLDASAENADGSKEKFITFLQGEKALDNIPVAPFRDNIFNVVFHNSAALWFLHEVGYLNEYLNKIKTGGKVEKGLDVAEEKTKEESESVGAENTDDLKTENGDVETEKAENAVNDSKEDQCKQETEMEVDSEKEVEVKNINIPFFASLVEKNCVCVARALGLIGKLIAVPLWTVLELSDSTGIKTRYATMLQKVELWSKDASHFMSGQERLFDDIPVSLDAVYISLIKGNDVYDASTKEILELIFTAFTPYLKYFLHEKAENCVVDDKRSATGDASRNFTDGSAFDRVTKNMHEASLYAFDALTVFSKARNGQWLDRLGSKNSSKIVDMIKTNSSRLLKSIYERKIALDDIKKLGKGEHDAQSGKFQNIEKKYKLIGDVVKCGGLWKSEKELDDHLKAMRENERLNALKTQIQFRRHVLNEVHEEGLLDLAAEGQCFNAAILCENLKAVLRKEFIDTESPAFEFASATDDEGIVKELSKTCQIAEDKTGAEKGYPCKENFQWLLGRMLEHTVNSDKGQEILKGICIARKKLQGVYHYYIRYSGKEKAFKLPENKIAREYQSKILRVASPSIKDLIGSKVSRASYKNDGELEWHDCKVIDILKDGENPLFAVEYDVYGANVDVPETKSDLPKLQTLTFACHLLEDYKTERLRLL